MRSAHLLPRIGWFYVGLGMLSWGVALMIGAGLGAGPWDIFHIGVTRQLPLSLGLAVQLTGVAIIGINWLIGIRPTLGMVLNMASGGPLIQLFLGWLPAPSGPAAAWAMLGLGVLVAGVGTAFYASADLGAGPRDGMMLGLSQRLGLSVGLVKNGMDFTVTVLGWLMGGPVGAGTLAIMVAYGWSVQLGLIVMRRLGRLPVLERFVRPPLPQKAS